MTMRTLLISTVSSMALATSAFAADLPNTKGPAPFLPPPPPIFSWTGFYVGINAGGSLGNFNKSNKYDGDPFAWDGTRADGFSGGGQIGFNYQLPNNVVFGLEADFQGSTLKGHYGNRSHSYSYGEGEGPSGSGSSQSTSQSSLEWWGTARGRLGYAFGNVLPYVTGGFAYGRIHNSSTYSASGSGYHGFFGEGAYSYSHYDAHSSGGIEPGWTIGAGLEYALTHNLTVKFEYLYTELGAWSHNWDNDPGYSTSTRLAFHTVRAGLNWKFDWLAPPAPVVAKY